MRERALGQKSTYNPGSLLAPVAQTQAAGHYDRSMIDPVGGSGGGLRFRVLGRLKED